MTSLLSGAKCFIILVLICSATYSGAAAAQNSSAGNIDAINQFILEGKCADAEIYARGNFQRPMFYTVLGMIFLDCRNNRKTAIDYLKLAAASNDSVAIEMLIRLGEDTSRYRAPAQRKPVEDEEYEKPPSHAFAPPPQPRPRPQAPPIIIVTPRW